MGARFGAPGAIIGGALGAAAGGSVADIAQAGIEELAGSEFAPEGIGEAVTNAVKAGGQEAVFDLVGNLGFRTVRGLVKARPFRPKASENAELIVDILNKGGSGPSLAQITDNAFYSNVEGIVRDALVGSGQFKSLDLAQDVALTKFSKDFVEQLGGVAERDLTERASGKMFLDVITKGKQAHSAAAGTLYKNLDELVPSLPISRVSMEGGEPVFQGLAGRAPRVNVTTQESLLPVDMTRVKADAKVLLDQFTRTGNVGKIGDGGKTLSDIVNADDRLLFSDAHTMRSRLLAQSRGLSQTDEGRPIAKNLRDFIGKIDTAMDDGGKALNPEGLKAYRNASRFWKQGEQRFNNEVIQNLMSKKELPVNLGDALFKKNNFDEVLKVRQAMRTAVRRVEGKTFTSVWNKVQAGYMKSLFPQSAEEVLAAPIRTLHKDKKALRTMSAMFDKTQRGAIKDMSKAFDDIVSSREAKGFLNLRQLTAGVQVAGGLAAAGDVIGLGAASIFFSAPLLFSQIAARPKIAVAWTKWAKLPAGTPAKAVAAAKFARLIGMNEDELREISGEEAVPPKRQVRSNTGHHPER